MLTLTRRIGQALTIGDDICITLLGIRGKQIRLGVEAPAEVVVLRGELQPAPEEKDLPAPSSPKLDLHEFSK